MPTEVEKLWKCNGNSKGVGGGGEGGLKQKCPPWGGGYGYFLQLHIMSFEGRSAWNVYLPDQWHVKQSQNLVVNYWFSHINSIVRHYSWHKYLFQGMPTEVEKLWKCNGNSKGVGGGGEGGLKQKCPPWGGGYGYFLQLHIMSFEGRSAWNVYLPDQWHVKQSQNLVVFRIGEDTIRSDTGLLWLAED